MSSATKTMNSNKTPAKLAHERHIKYIHENNREAWLDNMADDVVVEDPVGPTVLNPEGKPLDKDGMALLWDRSQGKLPADVPPPRHEMHTFYCCGNEVCCVGRTVSLLPRKGDGKLVECIAEGVYIYGVNEEGKIKSVRGFFDFDGVFGDIDFSLAQDD